MATIDFINVARRCDDNHAVSDPGRLWRQPGFELRHKTIEMIGGMVGRDDMHRPRQLHSLVEPGGHLLGTRVPVRRYIGVIAGNGDQPWPTFGRELGEWIEARDMKLDARRPAVRLR